MLERNKSTICIFYLHSKASWLKKVFFLHSFCDNIKLIHLCAVWKCQDWLMLLFSYFKNKSSFIFYLGLLLPLFWLAFLTDATQIILFYFKTCIMKQGDVPVNKLSLQQRRFITSQDHQVKKYLKVKFRPHQRPWVFFTISCQNLWHNINLLNVHKKWKQGCFFKNTKTNAEINKTEKNTKPSNINKNKQEKKHIT